MAALRIVSAWKKTTLLGLIDSYKQLKFNNDEINWHTTSGEGVAKEFLSRLEECSEQMCTNQASRQYRSGFTSNYQNVLPVGSTNFSFELIKAAVENRQAIYVNGEKFTISPQASQCAIILKSGWSRLLRLLKRLAGESVQDSTTEYNSLYCTLVNLDAAWAAYEEKYINNLIEIEEISRSFIRKAIDLEAKLTDAEVGSCLTEAEDASKNISERRRKLVEAVCELRAATKNSSKAPKHFDAEILEVALTFKASNDKKADSKVMDIDDGHSHGCQNEAVMLADDVIDTFEALRDYLRQVASRVDSVDPNLRFNKGLMQRLTDWEDAWKIGEKFVCQKPMLRAVSAVFDEFKQAQRVEPDLQEMLQDCDVELFLCLPRLIWLRFLEEPETMGVFVKALLPDRCASGSKFKRGKWMRCCKTGDEFLYTDEQLCQFMQTFKAFVKEIQSSYPELANADMSWKDLLTPRIISGTDGMGKTLDIIAERGLVAKGRSLQEIVEPFMMELEGWSLEMQRHCPQDWNGCSAMLIQCLQGAKEAPPTTQKKFLI